MSGKLDRLRSRAQTMFDASRKQQEQHRSEVAHLRKDRARLQLLLDTSTRQLARWIHERSGKGSVIDPISLDAALRQLQDAVVERAREELETETSGEIASGSSHERLSLGQTRACTPAWQAVSLHYSSVQPRAVANEPAEVTLGTTLAQSHAVAPGSESAGGHQAGSLHLPTAHNGIEYQEQHQALQQRCIRLEQESEALRDQLEQALAKVQLAQSHPPSASARAIGVQATSGNEDEGCDDARGSSAGDDGECDEWLAELDPSVRASVEGRRLQEEAHSGKQHKANTGTRGVNSGSNRQDAWMADLHAAADSLRVMETHLGETVVRSLSVAGGGSSPGDAMARVGHDGSSGSLLAGLPAEEAGLVRALHGQILRLGRELQSRDRQLEAVHGRIEQVRRSVTELAEQRASGAPASIDEGARQGTSGQRDQGAPLRSENLDGRRSTRRDSNSESLPPFVVEVSEISAGNTSAMDGQNTTEHDIAVSSGGTVLDGLDGLVDADATDGDRGPAGTVLYARQHSVVQRLFDERTEAEVTHAQELRERDRRIASLMRERLGLEIAVLRLRTQMDRAGMYQHNLPKVPKGALVDDEEQPRAGI